MRSLRFKASLMALALVVVATLIASFLSKQAMSLVFYQSEYKHATEWAESIASGAVNAVTRQDRETLHHTATDLVASQGVNYVVFTDASGKVLASGEAMSGLLDPELKNPQHRLGVASLNSPELLWCPKLRVASADVVVPVYSTQVVPTAARRSRPIVGYLRFGSDITGTTHQLKQVASRMSQIGMGLMLLAIPVSLLVTRHVVRPLNKLTDTARAIASGSVDARAEIMSNDEIGELARSFNTMADRITESRLELLELNAALEQRVQQRTRELEELAARDPLTNLYNRRHFGEVIAREFATAERYDADLTCLMFDLDHFKEINDLYGHRAGDEIITLFAQALHAELRESDVPARFGGDEFIVLLPRTSSSSAALLVERICDRFQETVHAKLPEVPTSVSIGVASLRTTRATSAEALIHEADLALYAAKEGGRNRLAEGTETTAAG